MHRFAFFYFVVESGLLTALDRYLDAVGL